MAKILLAEDDLFIRDIYSEVLKDEKYDLRIAVDGEDTLQKLKQGGWDIVLLDVMMHLEQHFFELSGRRRRRRRCRRLLCLFRRSRLLLLDMDGAGMGHLLYSLAAACRT